MAGILGAVGDNSLGVSGVAQQVSIMPLKFLGANNDGFVADAVRASAYVTTMRRDKGINVRVVNATPHVSGAAALLFSVLPDDATAQEVRAALLSSTAPLSTQAERDRIATGGHLNVHQALLRDTYAPRVTLPQGLPPLIGREFTTPGDNGTGSTNDWVLVLETAASPPRTAAVGMSTTLP